MARKVAICAWAQTSVEQDKWRERFQGMALEVVESLLAQTGLDFSEQGITMSINVSDDIFDARTISDNAMTDVLGAHFGCEEKVSQDGAQAIYYGWNVIQAGLADVVLVVGHCKESQSKSRNMVTHMAFDPFYTRPVGLDFLAAAGLQAQAFVQASGVNDHDLARVVVRACERGVNNKYYPEVKPVSEDEVLSSPLLADPIRSLHAYPVSDAAVGVILAAEERAKEITDSPVWIKGAANCMDSFFLGDRDLLANMALKKATAKALSRAGLELKDIDLFELSDQFAYQLPLWAEGVGLTDLAGTREWLADDGLDKNQVNPSGGMLIGSPLILGGLLRTVEVCRQLQGRAGLNQVAAASTGLAHGVMGPAGQFHSVVILGCE